MLPVTGPFLLQKVEPIGSRATYYWEQRRWRQKKPYNLPLRYSVLTRKLNITTNGNPSYGASDNFNRFYSSFLLSDEFSGDSSVPDFVSIRNSARNVALKRFNGKRGDSAALAVALAEGRESLSMITKRALQLGTFLNHLRKGNVVGAADALGVRGSPQWRKLSKSGRLRDSSRAFASNWLEFSFGWKPMVSDMYTALEVLSTPAVYQQPVKVSGRLTENLVYGSQGPGRQWASHSCEAQCVIGAVLNVSNPNKDLTKRLGLTNPLAVINELIPFSFVLNWFVNVEETLGQFDQYYGVEVMNPYFSDKFSDNCSVLHQHWSGNPAFSTIGSSQSKSFERTVGWLPAVTLEIRPVVTLPITRALNAISLLTQIGIRAGRR